MLLRYAFRELRNSPRFCLLFCLNMTLGLTGFIALDVMKRSFEERLNSSAKNIIAADASISARRALSDDELTRIQAVLPSETKKQELLSLFSMVSGPKRSQLVELKAIEQGFPFYGQLTLERRGIYTGDQALPLLEAPKAWLAPELIAQLDVKPNEKIRIGSLDFIVDDILLDDTTGTMFGTAMAPRIYIGRNALEQSGLIQFGSTKTQSVLFKIPQGNQIEKIEEDLGKAIEDSSVRISVYSKAGQDNGRMLAYLSDYLGLVSLVALALAAIGAGYLFRMYLQRKQAAIATLVSLGLTHGRAMLLYMLQLCLLGTFSAFLAIVASKLLLPFAPQLLASLSPIPLQIELSAESMLLALGLGILGSIAVCLPALIQIRKLNPSLLFQELGSQSYFWQATLWVSYLPTLLAFYGLSIWQAHSIKVGTYFCLTLLLLTIIFSAIAWIILRAVTRLTRRGSLSTRLAIIYLRSSRSHALNSFVALGIGAALINLIPQIQHSIASELERPDGEALPSLFLFDIQDDQIKELKTFIEAQGLTPKAVAPMIMARLKEVNNQIWQRKEEGGITREAEQEERSRNRGVNLSFRTKLTDAESIAAGEFFKDPYDPSSGKLAEISLEQRYAERLGLKIGDKLTFDVQGLAISGQVSSLRRVKWNTFEPNFFIVLQPGLIDDAPKTFLMTLPELSDEQKQSVERITIENFPNIAIIDVSRLVGKLSELIKQMTLVLLVMGWLTVLTGHAVIFSIAQNQALARRWDTNLLKILGADFSVILRATLKEFGLLSLGAAILGAILGLGASFIVARMLFQGLWQPSLSTPIIMSGTLLGFCLITSYGATRSILGEKPTLQLEDE